MPPKGSGKEGGGGRYQPNPKGNIRTNNDGGNPDVDAAEEHDTIDTLKGQIADLTTKAGEDETTIGTLQAEKVAFTRKAGEDETTIGTLQAEKVAFGRKAGEDETTIGSYTAALFKESLKFSLLSRRFDLLERSLEQEKEKHLSATLEPSSRGRQRHSEMAGPGLDNLSVHLSSSAEMPFGVKQVLDLYFEHPFKDTKRPSNESDVWDFEASKMKTYTPVEKTTHYPQARQL